MVRRTGQRLLAVLWDRQLEVESLAVDVPNPNSDRGRIGPTFPPRPALGSAFELERRNQDGIPNSVDNLESQRRRQRILVNPHPSRQNGVIQIGPNLARLAHGFILDEPDDRP
jgi:hypothetical protein